MPDTAEFVMPQRGPTVSGASTHWSRLPTTRPGIETTIVEVLSAFVRVQSDPVYQYKASLAKDAPPEPAEEQRRKAAEHVAELDRPPVDVQAAATVLGRLPVPEWYEQARRERDEQADAIRRGEDYDISKLFVPKIQRADFTEANLTTSTTGSPEPTGRPV